jgi:hypothetical protein
VPSSTSLLQQRLKLYTTPTTHWHGAFAENQAPKLCRIRSSG